MTHSLKSYRHAHSLTLDTLAARLGVQRAAVWKWENGRVPAERVLDVERLTGLSRHDIRPDIYPRETNGLITPNDFIEVDHDQRA